MTDNRRYRHWHYIVWIFVCLFFLLAVILEITC